MSDQDDRTIAASSAPPVQSMEAFSKYILLKRLAAGGMAEVFLARPATSDGNGRIQVVKRILPHVAGQSMFVDMFRSEIQVIMGFNHPHIVQLHDFGQFGKQPFIAMEYIEGKSLKEIMAKCIQQKLTIPVPMALGLMAQAAAGLSYAHNFVNKVTEEVVHAIHRDISPHNLMVSYEGNLKVIDFGIAKAAVSVNETTRVGTIKGKMAYLSPEQLGGQQVDARTDIFALGIVAWELLTMKRAFITDGDSEVTVISKIDNCEKHLVAPSTLNKEIPPEVDEVIMKALKRNPNERYQSAKDFQAALRKVMQIHYPNYTYADTGQKVSNLFAYEMETERKELRDLNVMAQMRIVNKSFAVPCFVPEKGSIPINPNAAMPMAVATSTAALSMKKDQVDERLSKIESLMRQNASTKHFIWLAFYVVALVGIQLDGKYSIFNFLIPIPEVGVERAQAAPVNVVKMYPKAVPTVQPQQMPLDPQAAQVSPNTTVSSAGVGVMPSPETTPGHRLQIRPNQIPAARLLGQAVGQNAKTMAVRASGQPTGRLLSSADSLNTVKAPGASALNATKRGLGSGATTHRTSVRQPASAHTKVKTASPVQTKTQMKRQ